MNKNIHVLSILIILLSGCSTEIVATQPLTPVTLPSPTPILPTPTSTAEPTPTLKPSPTPFPLCEPSAERTCTVLISINSGFEVNEFNHPRRQLEAAGYTIVVAGPTLDQITGLDGATKVKPGIILTEANPADYDAIIFVGATDNFQYIAGAEEVHDLIRRALEEDIIVAGICNAVNILLAAEIGTV